MDERSIRYVLGVLGETSGSVSSKGWLRSTCPLAKFQHAKGTDNTPSFAASIQPDGVSHYRCQSCNSRGTLLDLVWTLERLSGVSYADLGAYVAKHNVVQQTPLSERLAQMSYGPAPPVKVAGIRVSAAKAPKQAEAITALKEEELDAFEPPPPTVLEYLKGPKRGLTDASIAAWEICWQPEAQRVGIPVRNVEGALVGISGRAFRGTQKPKYLHSTGFQRQYYLYGEHKIERKNATAYIVEGFFDVIKLWQYGYDNVLAIMGSSLNEMQLEKLKKFFSKIVLVPDGDEPGYEAVEKMKQQLHRLFKIKMIPVPYGPDPDELSKEQVAELLGPPQRS